MARPDEGVVDLDELSSAGLLHGYWLVVTGRPVNDSRFRQKSWI